MLAGREVAWFGLPPAFSHPSYVNTLRTSLDFRSTQCIPAAGRAGFRLGGSVDIRKNAMWHGRLFTVIAGSLLCSRLPLPRAPRRLRWDSGVRSSRCRASLTSPGRERMASWCSRPTTGSSSSARVAPHSRSRTGPAATRRGAASRTSPSRPARGSGAWPGARSSRATCSRSTPARRRASSACGRAVRRLVSSTSRPAPSPPGSRSTASAVSAIGCS